MRKIASHYALIDGKLERNIVVEVDDARVIRSITRYENIDSVASVEFYPGILIPGMINAHCHLELSYLKGAIAEGGGYAHFAREIGRVRGGFSDAERIHAASVADAKMWEEGIEAVVDIANDELIMPIKAKSRIYYHTLFELFGLNNQNIESHVAMAKRHTNADVTPHSTYSVQDIPFREICRINERLLSLHFLESDDEAALYQHEGSLRAWYKRMCWECDFLDYGTPAERIAKSVAEDSHLLLVHATRATATDVMRIENALIKGATWVLCPESNRYISNYTPPVAMLDQMHARIAIGTDSLASARSLSMVDNMRLLGDMPLDKLLSYATINGAQALGIDATKGTLEVGKSPGLVIIEGVDLNMMRLTEDSKSYRVV